MSATDKLKELGIVSPEESVAKAIDRLSSKERIKMMSNLRSRKDVNRFALMYSVGEGLKLKWLIDVADDMLMLSVSLDKGKGRRQIVEVVRQPAVNLGGEGVGGKIKSFIRSGE